MTMHHMPYVNGSRPQVIAFDSRQPPVALGDEMAVLGAILVENASYSTVKDRVAVEHFSEPVHQKRHGSLA